MKISLIVALSFISLSELYATKESQTTRNERLHVPYNISKPEESIFQNILVTKENKSKIHTKKIDTIKHILPKDLQQQKYQKSKCNTPISNNTAPPIGCIKINIDLDMI